MISLLGKPQGKQKRNPRDFIKISMKGGKNAGKLADHLASWFSDRTMVCDLGNGIDDRFDD